MNYRLRYSAYKYHRLDADFNQMRFGGLQGALTVVEPDHFFTLTM
jgi:hypothetical protein